MKIGLLQCDHVAEAYHQFGGDYEQMFFDLLPGFDWAVYDVVNGHFPPAADQCDAYLCTGSKYSVYDDLPWIEQLKQLVQELFRLQIPYLGVCFGHQMLAEALGGKVRKSAAGWCVGVHHFQVVRREEWMLPFQPRFSLLMSCQDQVLQLPPGSTVLAETTDCRVGMFRVGARMLGLQAHPEFPKVYARALMEGRRERIGEEKTAAGLDSLALPLDKAVVAAWLSCFITS